MPSVYKTKWRGEWTDDLLRRAYTLRKQTNGVVDIMTKSPREFLKSASRYVEVDPNVIEMAYYDSPFDNAEVWRAIVEVLMQYEPGPVRIPGSRVSPQKPIPGSHVNDPDPILMSPFLEPVPSLYDNPFFMSNAAILDIARALRR